MSHISPNLLPLTEKISVLADASATAVRAPGARLRSLSAQAGRAQGPLASSSGPCPGTQPRLLLPSQAGSIPTSGTRPYRSVPDWNVQLWLDLVKLRPRCQGLLLCPSHCSSQPHVCAAAKYFLHLELPKKVCQIYSFSPVPGVTWEATPCRGRPRGVIYAHVCASSSELQWACNLALLGFVVSQPTSFFLISVCKRPL